jgi:uncharacterized protein with PIN domain
MTKTARFHFEETLTPLLPGNQRGGDFDYAFNGPQSVKHLIESMGIPHTEIGEVRANREIVGLDYLVHDGDQIEVRSAAPRRESTNEPRFVLDGHLGRLTSHLRMLGLDCLYRNDYTDAELIQIATGENRILLSRDRRLLMHKKLLHGYWVRSLEPEEQFREVVERYGLKNWIKPFRRCIRCNHLLEAVRKEDVLDRLEPLTKLYFDEFRICPACKQIYWKGSHFERMQKAIAELENL